VATRKPHEGGPVRRAWPSHQNTEKLPAKPPYEPRTEGSVKAVQTKTGGNIPSECSCIMGSPD